ARLIIADIAPKKYPVHHDLILDALNEAYHTDLKTREEAEEIISKYIDNAAVRMFLMKNLYWKSKGKLAWRINIPVLSNKIVEISEWGTQVKDIDIPTLFIRGGKSEYILESDYEDIEA